MKKITLILALLSITLGGFSQTVLKFSFNYQFNGQPFYLNQPYDDLSGVKANLTRVQFYISMEKAVHDGGNEMDLKGHYILAEFGKEEYIIDSNLSISDLEEIHFGFGVHPDVNHDDPATYAASHPLALQNPTMHWGWTAGYKFFALEGQVDSDNDQTPDKIFQMHAVGDEFYQSLKIVKSISSANGEIVIVVNVDVGQWFKDVDLVSVGILHGGGSVMENAVKNTPDVFGASTVASVNGSVDQVVANSVNIQNLTDKTILNYEMLKPLDATISIIDVTGNLVQTQVLNTQIGSIDITQLSNGVYIYNIESLGQSILSSKFVIY